MGQITVVIGDRLGKGQKVAAGVEKAGGRAVVVPGVAADMKLGDVMKAENATFGISFCGSGGAGGTTTGRPSTVWRFGRVKSTISGLAPGTITTLGWVAGTGTTTAGSTGAPLTLRISRLGSGCTVCCMPRMDS